MLQTFRWSEDGRDHCPTDGSSSKEERPEEHHKCQVPLHPWGDPSVAEYCSVGVCTHLFFILSHKKHVLKSRKRKENKCKVKSYVPTCTYVCEKIAFAQFTIWDPWNNVPPKPFVSTPQEFDREGFQPVVHNEYLVEQAMWRQVPEKIFRAYLEF